MKLINIKNVVIWTLVMINLLFLAVYLFGIYTDGVNKARTLSDLAALFEKSGITLNTKNIGEGGIIPVYAAGRDMDNEQKLAETLLGSTRKVDEGGNIIDYIGLADNGMAVFRSGGDFSVTLSPGTWTGAGDALTSSEKLLQALEIDTVSIASSGYDGSETVVAVVAVNGLPVFNSRVVMTYKKSSLVELSGKLAADIRQTEEKTDMSSPATALMLLLKSIKSNAIVCKEIVGVEPGYALTETSVPGEVSLQPVWRIDTGAGIYTVNTVSGKIEQGIE